MSRLGLSVVLLCLFAPLQAKANEFYRYEETDMLRAHFSHLRHDFTTDPDQSLVRSPSTLEVVYSARLCYRKRLSAQFLGISLSPERCAIAGQLYFKHPVSQTRLPDKTLMVSGKALNWAMDEIYRSFGDAGFDVEKRTADLYLELSVREFDFTWYDTLANVTDGSEPFSLRKTQGGSKIQGHFQGQVNFQMVQP